MIFVNLAVKDLDKSVEFFTKLGFTFNPQFTDSNATCMIVNDQAMVMLLVEPFFKTFTKKELAPASQVEAMMAISADSRGDVDEIVDKAITSGGQKANDPQDHGFMYSRSFEDLDGHIWEVIWMDMSGDVTHMADMPANA